METGGIREPTNLRVNLILSKLLSYYSVAFELSVYCEACFEERREWASIVEMFRRDVVGIVDMRWNGARIPFGYPETVATKIVTCSIKECSSYSLSSERSRNDKA